MKHYRFFILKQLSNDIKLGSLSSKSLRALFTNFLTPGLTCEFCNLLDDWLESTSPINHPVDYKIRGLTRELKSW